MYLSHPVRRIRDDPIEGESVTLLLDVDEDATSLSAVASAVEEFATVDREREFGTLEVSLPQERVGDLCALDGIDAIETAATIEMDPDGAGEDVEFP
ncbi:hypothetical protein QA599_06515 [Haloarculaceae archaeon H-GB1-1]|nr:hypothetical protein [Haloarculaceae archaeon H-GB1-1]